MITDRSFTFSGFPVLPERNTVYPDKRRAGRKFVNKVLENMKKCHFGMSFFQSDTTGGTFDLRQTK